MFAIISTSRGDRRVQVTGDAGGGRTRVRVLDANGEPGAEITVPSEALAAKPSVQPEATTRTTARSALEQLSAALAQLATQETLARGKKFPARLSERNDNASAFAGILKAAATEMIRGEGRHAAVQRAITAANAAEGLTHKSAEVVAKGIGTSHTRTSAIVTEMQKAARALLGCAEAGDDVTVTPCAAELKTRLERRARTTQKLIRSRAATPPETGREFITKPRMIRGREMCKLVSELGYDAGEIAREAERTTGTRKGALTAFLQEIGSNPNRGWLAYISALNPAHSADSALTRSEHRQLGDLIKRFASATAANGAPAREALENFMGNIRGRRLDDRTQAAVHEYAAARRRMEVLKDRVAEETDEGPGESVYDEHEESAAYRGYDASELIDD